MNDEKDLPMYLDYDGFRRHFAEWSDKKIKRNIIVHGLPAVRLNNGGYMIDAKAAHLWFKRRIVRAG